MPLTRVTTWRCSRSYVLLEVRDTGMGMDAETLCHIFEPFFTTKEVGKGSGLGLATAYGIVKQSKGHIDVSSGVGQGATFRVYLPRAEKRAAQAAKKSAPDDVKGGSETILLVEDEIIVRELATNILETYGYRVRATVSGQEALTLIEQSPELPALLITDVIMPGMSGRELVEQVNTKWPGIRTLYMSGYSGDVIMRHGELDPTIEFIQKPFSVLEFLKKVRKILDK